MLISAYLQSIVLAYEGLTISLGRTTSAKTHSGLIRRYGSDGRFDVHLRYAKKADTWRRALEASIGPYSSVQLPTVLSNGPAVDSFSPKALCQPDRERIFAQHLGLDLTKVIRATVFVSVLRLNGQA
jgi:hypothetical protein